MDVAIFDLDRTLIDCNSATLWVRAELAEGRMTVREVAWSSWWLTLYRLGWGSHEAPYHRAAEMLRGVQEAELRERVERWFARSVRDRLRPGAAAALAEHRRRGDHLLLATTSSPYAARAAATAYGLDDWVSTEFEVRAGRFTGAIAASALGDGKAVRVRLWLDRHHAALDRCTFYTDSISDLALMEQVGRAVAVNPDRRLRKVAFERGWTVVDWGRSQS